jgi:hypothetical protein
MQWPLVLPPATGECSCGLFGSAGWRGVARDCKRAMQAPQPARHQCRCNIVR